MPSFRPYRAPNRRPLKVFAFDPMLGRAAANRITLEVDNEPLLPGPVGAQIEVVDYDGAERVLYQPVHLDDPAALMNDGLEPSESDPRFHQQMVYAVAMRVLENFETALGRRLMFKGGRRLRLYPHAFRGANAFYDPKPVAVLFGYFGADAEHPGPNLPGQNVFSCVSHDIIAHEVSHALVDRLRPEFIEGTNRDVYAFHEGFADIVAIFQHFSFPQILAATLQETRGDLRTPNALADLAVQFGYATGGGRALRSAASTGPPDPTLYANVEEPHDRGSILVAAVFDAFFRIYQDRIADLVRIATGGTGVLPEGDLHPDLIGRIAHEASKTAQQFLTMAVRAFEYLPPVDVTFGDYLRALVTADFLAVPGDERGLRGALIEGFRLHGIHPEGVASLAEEALVWEPEEAPLELPFAPAGEALMLSARSIERGPGERRLGPLSREEKRLHDDRAGELKAFARKNARRLGLLPRKEVKLGGFHTVFRISPDGQLLIELVARFLQEDDEVKGDPATFGGVKLYGGCTIVAGPDGDVRYVIAKPIADKRRQALREHVAACDARDPMTAWGPRGRVKSRMRLGNFAPLHRMRPRRRQPMREEAS